MNIVGIDPSLSSTALIVNDKIFNYTTEKNAYNKSGLSKWYKNAEHIIQYRFSKQFKFKDYQSEQVDKLNLYESIIDNIIEDILENINKDEDTIVGIEGYSYSSAFGPIVDLVTFGTLLRDRVKKNVTTNIKYFAPKELKLKACKVTYEPIKKVVGKRKKRTVIEHRNNEGTAGGSFSKREMFLAIIENKEFDDTWFNLSKELEEEILGMKNIPKPFEDINDAYLICKILKTDSFV